MQQQRIHQYPGSNAHKSRGHDSQCGARSQDEHLFPGPSYVTIHEWVATPLLGQERVPGVHDAEDAERHTYQHKDAVEHPIHSSTGCHTDDGVEPPASSNKILEDEQCHK